MSYWNLWLLNFVLFIFFTGVLSCHSRALCRFNKVFYWWNRGVTLLHSGVSLLHSRVTLLHRIASLFHERWYESHSFHPQFSPFILVDSWVLWHFILYGQPFLTVLLLRVILEMVLGMIWSRVEKSSYHKWSCGHHHCSRMVTSLLKIHIILLIIQVGTITKIKSCILRWISIFSFSRLISSMFTVCETTDKDSFYE